MELAARVQIGEKGRIVIPAAIREAMDVLDRAFDYVLAKRKA